MKTTAYANWFTGTLAVLWLSLCPATMAAREVFQTPNNGSNLGIWQVRVRELASRQVANAYVRVSKP